MFRALPILFIFSVSVVAGDIVPAARRVDWTNHAGVRGGIMLNATQTLSSAMTVYTNLVTNGFSATVLSDAIQSCPSNQVVQLTNGTYDIAGVWGEKSGVVLRGLGPWVNDGLGTRIRFTAGFSGSIGNHIKNGYNENWNSFTAINLTNCVKGSLNITTMVAHGWSIGHKLIIDQLEDTTGVPTIESRDTFFGRDAGQRPFGMIATVTNVPSSTTAILDTPLIYSFSNNFTPQGVRQDNWVYRYAIESLTIDAQIATNTPTAGQFLIQAEGWAEGWLYDVELKGIHNRGVWCYGVNNVTFQRCYIHGGRPIGSDYEAHYDSNRAYGFYLGPHASGVLIVDCIFNKLTNPTSHEGNCSYIVDLANFYTNVWWKSTGVNEAPVRFGPLMHGPYPSFVLIEHCHIEGRARADDQFGSSGFWLWHRNVIQPRDRRTNVITGTAFQWSAVEIERQNHMFSFVGNLLGNGGENNYIQNGADYSETVDKLIWETGYQLNTDDPAGHDTNVLYTMIRWLNYDRLQNAISNHTANVGDTGNTTLQDSYVLSEKPAWWFALNYPPYDPNFPSNTNPTNIPAGWRFIHAQDHPNRTNPPAAAVGGGEGAGNQYRNRGKSRVSGFSPVF